MKKVLIDEDECLGCEACVEICPGMFGFDEDSEKAYVIDGHEDVDEDEVEDAMASCPVECIVYKE